MCVYCFYLLCIYKNIHMHAYISEKCYAYILNIFICDINYMNINICVKTLKYFQNVYCVCVFIYT